MKAAQKLIDYTTKNYSESNDSHMKKLRRQLVQAGFLDQRAPAFSSSRARARGGICHRRVFPRSHPDAGVKIDILALCRLAGWWAILVRVFISAGASRRGSTSIAPGFPISWISSSYAPTPASAWRRRSTASDARLADSYPSLGANIHMTDARNSRGPFTISERA
jgi:hypothetical protein